VHETEGAEVRWAINLGAAEKAGEEERGERWVGARRGQRREAAGSRAVTGEDRVGLGEFGAARTGSEWQNRGPPGSPVFSAFRDGVSFFCVFWAATSHLSLSLATFSIIEGCKFRTGSRRR
jgi:hypothetical protein